MVTALQAIYSTPAMQAPWYIALAIVAFPGILAVTLTMASVIVLRRVNRADGNPPVPARRVMRWTLLAGIIFGPLCQWGFQELSTSLTGVPMSWKLVIVAPFITGIAAMVAYEILRWAARDRWPGIYALISVRHDPRRGHAGESEPSDLTEWPRQ